MTMRFGRGRLLATFSALVLPTAAQIDLCCVHGQAADDQMGFAVGGVTTSGGASYALFGAPNGSGPTGANTGTVTVRGYANGRCTVPFFFPLQGSQTGEGFGAALARGAPGQGRFLVSSPQFDPPPLTNAGTVRIVDAATGVASLQVDGLQDSESFGTSIAVVGDFDGNGTIDFAGGAPLANRFACCFFDYRGAVRVADTAVRHEHLGIVLCCSSCCDSGERLGGALCELGDVNADGRSDSLLGSSRRNLVHVCIWDASAMPPAPAYLRSDPGPSTFGYSVCALDDLDGDGVREYAAGAPNAREVWIVSGAGMTMTVIRKFVGVDPEFGYALAEVGDQDGRGKADLLIGAPGASGGDGAAYLFSTETGNLLGVVRGAFAGERLGSAIAKIDDWSGDGRPEFAIGAPSADVLDSNGTTLTDAGRAVVMSLDLRGVTSGHGCAAPPTCTSGIVPRACLPRGTAYPGFVRFEIGVAEAMPGSRAVLFLGVAPLPFAVNLGFLHPCLSTCDFFVDVLWSPARSTTSATTMPQPGQGYAVFPVPVSLGVPIGAQLYGQWYVVDPGPSPLPATMTATLTVTVGPPGC